MCCVRSVLDLVCRSVSDRPSQRGRDAAPRGSSERTHLSSPDVGPTRQTRHPRGPSCRPADAGQQQTDGSAPGGPERPSVSGELDRDGVQTLRSTGESVRVCVLL